MAALDQLSIDVSTHGRVTAGERAYAEQKLSAVAQVVPDPLLHARLRLVMEPDPARERPAVVQGTLDVNGRVVRAHVAAPTMREAIDRFEYRLRERLERLEHVPQSEQLRHRDAGPGEWHRGDATTQHPERFERPVEEREVLARKEFAVAAETVDEAVFDMESLDHDFFLFTNIDTGEDNVVHRVGGDGYEIIEPTPVPDQLTRCAAPIRLSTFVPPRLRLDDAVELLSLGNEAFVFFLDDDTGRGNVLYRRYDGHYGLIRPAGS